jgi:hypothetical protein
MAEPQQTITAEKLCALTGLTDRRHRQLAKDGYFPPPVKGQYQVGPTLAGMFRYYRETREARDALRDEKVRETRARADLFEIEKRVKEKELVPLDEAKSVLTATLSHVRSRFVALPAEMAARTNPTDPAFARKALEQWRDEALKICREKIR